MVSVDEPTCQRSTLAITHGGLFRTTLSILKNHPDLLQCGQLAEF